MLFFECKLNFVQTKSEITTKAGAVGEASNNILKLVNSERQPSRRSELVLDLTKDVPQVTLNNFVYLQQTHDFNCFV